MRCFMSMNSFAPFLKQNTSFVVKNIITESNKVVRIFQYPIPVGQERDLLSIPGVGESDIRASLLKGEILHKLLAREIIVVFSDIDLLQFNNAHKLFLQNSGITIGLEVTGAQGALTPSDHEILRQAIHFLEEGPGDGFATGAFKEILPLGSPFPLSIIWYFDSTKTKKIVEKLITRNSDQFPTDITVNIYDTDGITIAHSITDNITYTNTAFESSRTRTII